MYLTFYIFLFKFKSIEIQIDRNNNTVDEAIQRLKSLKRIIRISLIALLSLKIIFVGFWAVANIVVIYDQERL